MKCDLITRPAYSSMTPTPLISLFNEYKVALIKTAHEHVCMRYLESGLHRAFYKDFFFHEDPHYAVITISDGKIDVLVNGVFTEDNIGRSLTCLLQVLYNSYDKTKSTFGQALF
jgi:hypothetical protein